FEGEWRKHMRKGIYGAVIISVSLLLSGCAEHRVESTSNVSEINNSSHQDEGVAGLLNQFSMEQADSIVTTSVSISEMLNILNVKPVGVPSSTHPLPE